MTKLSLIAIVVSNLTALVIPAQGEEHRPGFLFLRQTDAYVGGNPVQASIIYLSEQGLAQRIALRERQLLSLAEGAVTPDALFQEMEGAMADLAELSARPVATTSESEYEPARTEVMLRSKGGREWRWAGPTSDLNSALTRIIKVTQACCKELKPQTRGPQDNVYIHAMVLDKDAVTCFQKDGLFVSLDGREAAVAACLLQALAQPYCLVAVPKGVNPFAPWHQVFATGNVIEIQHGTNFFQVVSYGGSKQASGLGPTRP